MIIDDKKKLTIDRNLRYVRSLYFWLGPINTSQEEKWAVYFGSAFKKIIDEIDYDKFIEKSNQCLDYIRKNCPDCKLIYRSHPDESDEVDLLNLTLFDVQKDKQIAEDFLWENRPNIKYLFSVASLSSLTGFDLGLNAYSFFRYFRNDVFKDARRTFIDHLFDKLPPQFFIESLNNPLLENKVTLEEDSQLKNDFKKILAENKGPIWFVISENRFMLYVLSLAKMISAIDPQREVNLIISKHHRWAEEKIENLRSEFNQVIILPRVFYSLKPSRLLSAFRTARKIKKIPLDKESVIIGFAHHDFIENCLVSYNKDKFRISFLLEQTWKLNFKTEELDFGRRKFKFNKAGVFYNRFFEPLLGLNRTKFVDYGSGSKLYYIRFQKPLEDIYDRVYLIKNSPVN